MRNRTIVSIMPLVLFWAVVGCNRPADSQPIIVETGMTLSQVENRAAAADAEEAVLQFQYAREDVMPRTWMISEDRILHVIFEPTEGRDEPIAYFIEVCDLRQEADFPKALGQWYTVDRVNLTSR